MDWSIVLKAVLRYINEHPEVVQQLVDALFKQFIEALKRLPPPPAP